MDVRDFHDRVTSPQMLERRGALLDEVRKGMGELLQTGQMGHCPRNLLKKRAFRRWCL
jgi:hypothetical protein